MSDYLDSSVLIAALVDSQPFHEECADALAAGGITSAHALAEAYSILSGRLRLDPQTVSDVLLHNTKDLKKVDLTWSEYSKLIASSPKNGVRGGAIFDALHVAAARKASAKRLLTLDQDYYSFAPDLIHYLGK
ncbi:MAG TPA: PIN domain-containing protein [Verrucomicrobiae bacterium]